MIQNDFGGGYGDDDGGEDFFDDGGDEDVDGNDGHYASLLSGQRQMLEISL